MPDTFAAGMARVLNGSFALIGQIICDANQRLFQSCTGDNLKIKYAEMTNCDLRKVGNVINRRPIAIGVQKDSPMKDMLSQAYATACVYTVNE